MQRFLYVPFRIHHGIDGHKADRARVAWIDNLKGIGIILVVIGHTFSELAGHPFVDAIYLFHMPLFFFLSGVVFRPAPFGDYLHRRIASLLLPYLAFLVALILGKQALNLVHGVPLPTVLADDLQRLPAYLFGVRELTGDFQTYWFVTCLFIAVVAYDILRLWLGAPGRAASSSPWQAFSSPPTLWPASTRRGMPPWHRWRSSSSGRESCGPSS